MPLFPGIEPDEKIILNVHRHWWILFRTVVAFTILLTVPFLGRWLLAHSFSGFMADPQALSTALIQLAALLYWLFIVQIFFSSWLDYYLDYWVITDKRIVSVEQSGLFSRQIAEVHLSRIQDATADTKGILATFLEYGNVLVQSAGEQDRFVFEQVPNPNKIVAMVMELHEKVTPLDGQPLTTPPTPVKAQQRQS